MARVTWEAQPAHLANRVPTVWWDEEIGLWNWRVGQGPAAFNAEMIVDSCAEIMDPKLKLRPTDYWQRDCYSTVMSDAIGFERPDYIGAVRVMFAVDYPHNEGMQGNRRGAIEAIVDAVSSADARKIPGEHRKRGVQPFLTDMPETA